MTYVTPQHQNQAALGADTTRMPTTSGTAFREKGHKKPHMNTLLASFEIVTPMFLGGADPTTPQGIRPASVKGALRFWWRALNWSRVAALQGQGQDQHAALRQLHEDESRLFGHSATDSGGGQGVFLMQVIDRSGAAQKQPFGAGFDNGILYLLGQGLGSFKDGNHCTRAGLAAGGGFDVRLLFRPTAKQGDIASVVQAVQLFGLLGALGSRARHGMGSVALTNLKTEGLDLPAWAVPTTPEDYRSALTRLLAEARRAPGLPPLSAFSAGSRLDLSMQRTGKDAATKLLADLGREQQAYRSYGRHNQVNGKPSERNFVPDHDLVREVANGERNVKAAPQRVVFGLPHNYFFSSDNAKVDINYRPNGEEARRASPLLLHVHRLGDGRAVAVHTLLRSRFLPEAQPVVTMKPGRARTLDTVPVTVDWNILTAYLDRFKTSSASDWATL
jgi:CRISPR-associated protein Cmr1